MKRVANNNGKIDKTAITITTITANATIVIAATTTTTLLARKISFSRSRPGAQLHSKIYK